MVLLDKIIDYFSGHVAVVNEDEEALKEEVAIVREKYGPWPRVKGFTSYTQLFFALHLAQAKQRPFSLAFIKNDEPNIAEMVLKRTAPSILTIKYSDSQTLKTLLPTPR